MAILKIEEALQRAEQNPNSDFATFLRKEIESGRMDAPAQKQGVDLSRFGRPSVETLRGQGGFLREGIEDIKDIGRGIAESARGRADTVSDIRQAGRGGEQGIFRSLMQTFGQGTGLASDVIGETVIGAGKALLPQAAEEKVGEVAQVGFEKVADTPVVRGLINSFQELEQTNPSLARDVEAFLNTALLGADLATGGVTGRGVATTAKGAVRGAGQIAERGVESVVRPAGRLAKQGVEEVQGALTGTSQETLEQAFQAVYKGGKDADAFTKALRSQTTPEELVENVRSSVDIVANRNSARYREGLEEIGDNLVDTSNTLPKVQTKLNEFGVKVRKDGTLDFSNSKFRTVPQAQNKLQSLYDEVARIGTERTLRDVDTTRQALKELILTGDDASARSANAVITDAINEVRDSGKSVKGYEKILTEFGDDAEFLNEIQRSLSTGDRATVDTAYRKLATSLKTNNERRRNLIQELDNVTDGALLSSIAGQQLSEVLPRGLFRQIAAGMAGAGLVTGGITASAIPALLFASPKVTGEVIRALGLSAKKTKTIIDAINTARKTVNVDKLFVPTPLPSAVEQSATSE